MPVLIILFILIQVFFLDFDHLLDLSVNKQTYITIVSLVLLLLGYMNLTSKKGEK